MQQDGSSLEQIDNTSQILVLKKKFFVSEGSIDRDDPVQLHLVYSQAKDDLVNGRYPVARDEAVQLAALQCQVENGNFTPQLFNNIK